MADYDEEETTRPGYVPALDQIVQAVPNAAGIDEAAAHLNNYVQQRDIADANTAAGQNLVDDMSSFKDGLVQFVSSDPGGVHAALAAVPPVVDGIVRTTPGIEDDAADGHVDNITRHFQGEIATAAVTSAAERDAGFARSLLDHPSIAGALPEGSALHLGNYIEMQDRARTLDGHVQQMVQGQAADARANAAMFSYASQLHDPSSGTTVFPSRWNQQVLADNSVTPADSAMLQRLYGRLAIDGGSVASDPFLVASTVRDIAGGSGPPVRDMLSHAAEGNLRFQDALHLASLGSDRTDAGRDHAAGLSGILDQGRAAILGEDPVAGGRAYGRFVNAIMPQYLRSGTAGSNPEDPAYLLRDGLAQFMPRAEDLVPAKPREGRPSLKEIFSGR